MTIKKDVTLRITSDSLSLDELVQRFGPAGSGSHDKSDLHRSGRTWGRSIGRFENENPESDLSTECERLVDFVNLASLSSDVNAVVDIVVYVETYTVSVGLPSKTPQKLGKHGIGVEITCYPISE